MTFKFTYLSGDLLYVCARVVRNLLNIKYILSNFITDGHLESRRATRIDQQKGRARNASDLNRGLRFVRLVDGCESPNSIIHMTRT